MRCELALEVNDRHFHAVHALYKLVDLYSTRLLIVGLTITLQLAIGGRGQRGPDRSPATETEIEHQAIIKPVTPVHYWTKEVNFHFHRFGVVAWWLVHLQYILSGASIGGGECQ